MKIKIISSLILFSAFFVRTVAQKTDWHGKQGAVVLTYDDALNVNLNNVIPALDSLDLKGTFFLTVSSPAFTRHLAEWKTASLKHELANHTVFHPCDGSATDRKWVSSDYDLSKYSLRRITDEVKMANAVLQTVDGKTQRTFAYPCGDTKAGNIAYMDSLHSEFIAARGTNPELVKPESVDLYNIGCYVVNGQTGDQLIETAKQAIQTNSLVVFLFHGVGGEHSINVSLQAHSELLHFLKLHEKEIWNPTFIEAAEYLKGYHIGKH